MFGVGAIQEIQLNPPPTPSTSEEQHSISLHITLPPLHYSHRAFAHAIPSFSNVLLSIRLPVNVYSIATSSGKASLTPVKVRCPVTGFHSSLISPSQQVMLNVKIHLLVLTSGFPKRL